jgi:hypothetical protein
MHSEARTSRVETTDMTGRWITAGMSHLFVEHCEAVAAKINITRRWLGEQ